MLEALNLDPVGAVLEPDVFDPLLRMLVDDRPQTFQRNFLGAGTIHDICDPLDVREDGLDLQDAGNADGGEVAEREDGLEVTLCMYHTARITS